LVWQGYGPSEVGGRTYGGLGGEGGRVAGWGTRLRGKKKREGYGKPGKGGSDCLGQKKKKKKNTGGFTYKNGNKKGEDQKGKGARGVGCGETRVVAGETLNSRKGESKKIPAKTSRNERQQRSIKSFPLIWRGLESQRRPSQRVELTKLQGSHLGVTHRKQERERSTNF